MIALNIEHCPQNHTYSMKKEVSKERGIVKAGGVVIATSFGTTPDAIVNGKLNFDSKVTDVSGITHDLNDYIFKTGFEGTIIRVYYYDGIVYTSSHRKLDVSLSVQCGSRSYKELINELRPEGFNHLFNTKDKKHGRYSYTYLLVHDELNMYHDYSSQMFLTAVYKNDIHLVPNVDQNEIDEEMRSTEVIQPMISINEMNHQLSEGNFVIGVSKECKGGHPVKCLRLIGKAFHNAINIVDSNPNLNNRFYQLTSQLHKLHKHATIIQNNNIDLYRKQFPGLFIYETKTYEKHDYKLLSSAVSLIKSVKPSLRGKIVEYYHNYIRDNNTLINLVVDNIYSADGTSQLESLSTTMYNILDEISDENKQLSEEDFIEKLKVKLHFISGSTLYKLIKEHVYNPKYSPQE